MGIKRKRGDLGGLEGEKRGVLAWLGFDGCLVLFCSEKLGIKWGNRGKMSQNVLI